MSHDDITTDSKLIIWNTTLSLSLFIITTNYNNDNYLLDDIGTTRAVVGAITCGFRGLKWGKINDINSCSQSNNRDTNNDNSDNDYSNYWIIEDSYKYIFNAILNLSSLVSAPSSAMIQVKFCFIFIFIDMFNLNYITHKITFTYRTTTQDDIKGHKGK